MKNLSENQIALVCFGSAALLFLICAVIWQITRARRARRPYVLRRKKDWLDLTNIRF